MFKSEQTFGLLRAIRDPLMQRSLFADFLQNLNRVTKMIAEEPNCFSNAMAKSARLRETESRYCANSRTRTRCYERRGAEISFEQTGCK